MRNLPPFALLFTTNCANSFLGFNMASPFLANSLLVILLSLALAHDSVASSASIQDTCEHTPYTDLCLSTLRSDPRGATDDLKGFAATSIQAASISATNISMKIYQKLGTADDQFQLECFRDCYEEFMDAVDRLQESLGALDSESYADINSWVSGVMSDATSCGDGFLERPAPVMEPIKDDVEEFGRLCSIVLAIIKQLQAA